MITSAQLAIYRDAVDAAKLGQHLAVPVTVEMHKNLIALEVLNLIQFYTEGSTFVVIRRSSSGNAL